MMVPGGLRPKPIGEESEKPTTHAKSPRLSPRQTTPSTAHQVPTSSTMSRKDPTPRRVFRPLPPLPFVGKAPQKDIGYRKSSSLDLRARSDLQTSGKEEEDTPISRGFETTQSTRSCCLRELRPGRSRSACAPVRESREVGGKQGSRSQALASNPAYRSLPPTRVSCAQLESSGRPSVPPPKPPRTFAAARPLPPKNLSSQAVQAVQDKPPLPPRTPVFKLPPTPTAVSQSRPQNALPLPPRSSVWSHAHRDPVRPPLPPGRARGASGPPLPLPPPAHARARSPSSSSPSLPPPATRSLPRPLRHLSASSSDLRARAPPPSAPYHRPSPRGPRPATLPRWASLLLPGTRPPPPRKDSAAPPSTQGQGGPPASPTQEDRRSRPVAGNSRGLARWPSAPPTGRGPSSSSSSAPKPTVTSYTLMVYTDDSTTPPTTSIFLGPPVRR